MSRKPVVVVALLLLAVGVGAVGYAASEYDEVARGVDPAEPHLRQAYPRAAAAAYGRRVLVLRAKPLAPVAGQILESARAGTGWELHAAAPPGADGFAASLAELADDAAADWDDDGLLTAERVQTLAYAGVAIIVVEDGRAVLAPERAAETPGLAPETTVPGLRVRGAEPVLEVAGDEVTAGGMRPRLEPARVRDFQDGLWGGSVIVEVAEPATFVFAWPRAQARVTVDGVDVQPGEPVTALALVTLQLQAGDAIVDVTYGSASPRRSWAIGGALAVVAALLTLLLALRPHPERDEPEDDDAAERQAALDDEGGRAAGQER